VVNTEDILRLPITIPNVPQPYTNTLGSSIDFSNYSLSLLTPKGREIQFEGEAGTFNPKEDLNKLFLKKYNFSYWNRGEVDYCLDNLSYDRKREIAYTGTSGNLSWISPDTSLALRSKERGHPKNYLINLKNYAKKSWAPKSLDDLKVMVSKLKEFQNFISLSPISVPLTQTNFILNEVGSEFWWIRKFSNNEELAPILKAWHEAYPARIEWDSLGAIRDLESFDQTKAYLQALSELPSLDKENVAYTSGETRYKHPEAHPGSLYIIETTIPESLKNGPIPVGTYWPIGHIPKSNPMCRPFLDILDHMGIPYKILWSYQIILKDLDKRPFRDVAYKIWILEEYYKSQLIPLELKSLHYTVTGHMLGLYYEFEKLDIDVGDGETIAEWHPIGIRSTLDYNPPVACAVKSIVLCRTYRAFLETEDPVAIREDNITGRGINLRDAHFREKDSGNYLVIAPNIRDLPGDSILRHSIVEKYKDSTYFKLDRQYRNCIHGGNIYIPLGFPLSEEATCPFGNSYYRIPKNRKAIKGGELLSGEIEYIPPTYAQIQKGELNTGRWISEEWLENWVLKNTKT